MIHHLDKLEKIFYMFSNNIDWKIHFQDLMRFEKIFKSYLKKSIIIVLRTLSWDNVRNIIRE